MLLVWILILLGASFAGNQLKKDYYADYSTPNSESQHLQQVLEQSRQDKAGDTVDLVFRSSTTVNDPAFQQKLTDLENKIKALPGVVSFDPPQISPDQTTGIVTIRTSYDITEPSKVFGEKLLALREAASTNEATFEMAGQAPTLAQSQDFSSEGIGLLAAAIILLIAFGSVVAMGIPIGLAIFGLATANGLIFVLTRVVNVPDWAPIVASMIGIGVGIDYSLFIITRYRSSLRSGMDPEQAVLKAMNTAGRAVLFAGCTVVISLLGLTVMHLEFLYGVAFSASTAVLIVMLVSLTLLPAILGFAGRNIDKLRAPFGLGQEKHDPKTSFWYRWSHLIQRRPWTAAISGLVILLVLALPLLNLRLGFPDPGNEPTEHTTRRAYDLAAEAFGPGSNGPIVVLVEAPTAQDAQATVPTLIGALQDTKGVAAVIPPQGGVSNLTLLTVIPTTSPQDKGTESLINTLRNDTIPPVTDGSKVVVSVGGQTAAFIDSSRYIADRLLWFIGAVVILSFFLLMVVFRSIWVPVKAAVMNLLSISAAYGVMAYALSGSWLGDLVGIHNETPIPSFVPMMMFAILFGLSMDYEVFLLSRVREEYAKTGDNASAVADGLAATARVITAAAAIMVTVFAAFMLNPEVFVKAIGLGLATAILVDATVVRLLLVPATMELLGDRNWWYPKWLDRITPHVNIEGDEVVDLSQNKNEPELVSSSS